MEIEELLSWDEINNQVNQKLIKMYEEKTLDVDVYRKISRALNSVFFYLMTEEEETK